VAVNADRLKRSTLLPPPPQGREGDMATIGLAGCDPSLCGRRGLLSMGVGSKLTKEKKIEVRNNNEKNKHGEKESCSLIRLID
jgi:hypothetical protein